MPTAKSQQPRFKKIRNMKKFSLIVMMLFLITSFSSCVNNDKEGKVAEKKEIKKARSVGGTSEVLLITQNENQWN